MPAVSVYKPISEGDGNLVVLMSPDSPDLPAIGIVDSSGKLLDKGQYVGRTNGGRPTYRFPRRGADYASAGRVALVDGSNVYPIGNPALRDENVGPGSLPSGGARTSQQSRPTVASQSQSGPSLGGIALAGAAGLEKGDFKKAGNLLKGVFKDVKAPRFLERFGLGGSTQGGTTAELFGNSAVTPASMVTSTPAWASAINAAAPWALGGLVGMTFADMMLNRETSLQKWRRLSQEGYQAGKAGGERPNSLLNHFETKSAPQVAYDMGKAGKKLAFDGGLNAKDFQRQQQATAKKNILSQGFDETSVRNVNQGPIYTQKQKAAQKILKPATNSQVNMLNPYVLTDADRGGK